MEINTKFEKLADEATTQKVIASLKAKGMTALLVKNPEEAKAKVMEILPDGAEVMNMTSMTLEGINVVTEINESEKYISVKKILSDMDPQTQAAEKRRLGAAPDWAIGSVHAITETGQVLIASNTGSQLPAYAYGAKKVIWVVGTHKIVKDTAEGLKRIYEYSLPLEDIRAQKAYGSRSGVNKILMIQKENQVDRITIILVPEKLGY